MFAILKKLVGGRAAKVRKSAAGFRPALEALESRDLMSVAGYSAVGLKDFFIDAYNNLKERDQYGHFSYLASSVSQVSVLKSDSYAYSAGSAGGLVVNFGDYASARADVLMQNGDLKQWDDATGLKTIATGVKQVSAGWDGNSAVLFSNGNLSLYNTDTNALKPVASNITSASIGLDLKSLPMLDMVTTSGFGYEWHADGDLSNLGAGRFYSLGPGVKQISAGVGSHAAILLTAGWVYDHSDIVHDGNLIGFSDSTGLATSVASVSCGTDNRGGLMIDVVHSDGSAWEYSGSTNSWKYLGGNVVEVDAGYCGVTYLCYGNGYITRFNDNGGGSLDTFTTISGGVGRNGLG